MGLIAGIAAGALAAGASAYGASRSANAQKSATISNNKANYRMFREARGEGGSAVLPLYLRTRGGRLLEDVMGQDAANYYTDTANDVSQQDFEDAANSTADARRSALGLTDEIFNGGVTNRMMTNFKPVKDARVRFRRQSSIDALNKTLGDIEAMQAGKGYAGDSMGKRRLMFDANRRMYSDVGDANLQNLMVERAILDYGDVQLPLNSLQLPYQMAQAESQQLALPSQGYANWMQARQQPLRFFYIGPSQPFQNKEVPTGMNGWQIAGSQLGTLGGAGLNYYMKQKEMAQLQDMMANNQAMANIYSGGVYPGAGGAGFYSDTTGAYPMSVPVSGAL